MSNWNDTFWLEMAKKYAEGSKDPSTKVGCVIVRPDRTPCSWGTNGFPQGIADTPERLNDRPTKYDLTIHAELNALLFAPERVVGYTLYSTFAPCIRCAVNIIQAKIAKVVFYLTDNKRWQDEQMRSIALFLEAGVMVVGIDQDDIGERHMITHSWLRNREFQIRRDAHLTLASSDVVLPTAIINAYKNAADCGCGL